MKVTFFQLLKLQQTDVEGLQSFIDEGQYLSHEIINELFEMMAHKLLRGLLDEIKIVEWFAIIADETSDISHTEQLATFFCWVDTNYISMRILLLCVRWNKQMLQLLQAQLKML